MTIKSILACVSSAESAPSTLDVACRLSAKFDCDAVQASSYAKVFDVPLSVWGAAGNLILLVWLVASRRAGTLLVAAGALAAFNLLASLYTMYVSWFELETFCLYCSGMQLGSILLAVLVVPPALRTLGTDVEARLAYGSVLALGGLEQRVHDRAAPERRFAGKQRVERRTEPEDAAGLAALRASCACSGAM